MNAITAFAPTTAPVTRPDAASRSDVQERDGAAPARTPSHAEFAAMLALLAGAGTRVRTDLLKTLPPEGASLIDRLLNGAAPETGAAPTGDVPTGDVPTGDMPTGDMPQATSDVLRYAQLVQAGLDRGNDGILSTEQSTDEANGIAGRNEPRGAGTQALLARIASRRGASVEQLLALGDDQAADVRGALDGILARAGTPAGAELASMGAANPGLDVAAASAASAALAAANARSAADVGTPVRDPAALSPQFRERLERVIARMKREYGHDVELVETARSQERQDHLFEQGRTRPGNIVTWTRDSAHTRGHAADVLVDGKWNNAEGYARLQRIAREEGLRTLGVRDPGHLELPRDGATADAMLGSAAKVSARIERPLPAPSTAQAPVAGIASVAGVAGVARVATTSGNTGGAARTLAPVDTGSLALGATVTQGSNGANGTSNGSSNGNAFGRGERDEAGKPMNDGRKLGHDRSSTDAAGAYGTMSSAAMPVRGAQSASDVAGTAHVPAGADAVQRATELQDRREAVPGNVTRLTLDVDAPNGGSDRITLDMRGSNVSTHITTDAANADRLRARTGELQDSLSRVGLESDSVRVSGSTKPESAESVRTLSGDREALRTTGAQAGAQGDGATGQGARERAPGSREWDERLAKDDKARDEREARERQAQDRQRREQQARQQTHINGTTR